MIPVWQHALVVLTLLGLHGLSVYWCRNRIQGLEAALVAKRSLLGESDCSLTVTGKKVCHLMIGANDTLRLTLNGTNTVELLFSNSTNISWAT